MLEKAFAPERLKEAMNGMSNVELAAQLGCARSNISMYLSGERTPSRMTVQLLAICLNVSPAWLMGLDVPKYIEKASPTSTEEALRIYAESKKGGALTDEELARLDDFAETFIKGLEK